MKKFYFDTETTGIDPIKNDIIQLAGIIEIDGEEKERFVLEMQPFNYDNIDQRAIDTHGVTIEKMKTFDSPQKAFSQLILNYFVKYIDKYDKNDKFIVCGYNVRFDIDFLNQFFKKNNDNYLFSYFGASQDPFPVLAYLKAMGKFESENLKLGTVCKKLNINLDNAHDAMADIEATKKLIEIVNKHLKFEV